MIKFILQLAATLLVASHATADTGLQALTAATTGSVLEVTGLRGQDQPTSWRVTRQENGAIVDSFVSRGSVSAAVPAQRSVGGSAFSAARVRYDSTHAFARANSAAQRAKVGFDSANYRLRSTGGAPFWELQLANKAGAVVGYLRISASTGEVISNKFQSAPAAPGSTAYYNPSAGSFAPASSPQSPQSMTGFGGFIQRLLGRR
jgi:hypothetical protein